MAVSGTVTYRNTRDEIIKGALRLVGAYDPENTSGPTAGQISNASEALNQLLKFWETQGLHLWERRYGVIFPQYQQSQFVLGSPGPAGDHACLSTPLGTGFVQTTLSADAASGDSTVSVTSISSSGTVGTPAISMANGYYIGIQLDSGELYWTTVSGAPSGTTVTLAVALTGAASSGNTVYSYQTKLIRPTRIKDAFLRQVANGNDVPCMIIAREVYNRFGGKTTSFGTPVQIYYDPQRDTGNVYLYPGFSSVTQLLYIEFEKPIDDITAADQDYDLPQEWGAPLKFNLALVISPEYEVSTEKFKQIKVLADEHLKQVEGWDQEDASLQLQPANWVYNQQGF